MAEIAAPGRSSRPLLGVRFRCAACGLFPIMNGLVKLLAATYVPLQIVWFRVTMHLFLVALVFRLRMGLGLCRTRRIGSQLVNSVMMLLSTLFFFSAVKYVGVAEAISISFVAPLAVVFLAWPILGERITPMRVAAVVVGFAGVLVVIRPGSALFQWASVLLLGSAICYAIYQIIIRRLAGVDHPATSIFYSVLLGAILLSALVPIVWKTPVDWRDWLLLCSLGALGGLAHSFAAPAITYPSPNFLPPFTSTPVIGSVIGVYLMFARGPGLSTWP